MNKPKKFPGNAYCVFQDVQRHTCIRVNVAAEGVHFIPMDASGLELRHLSNMEFEQMYIIELKDYPVKKAAESYLTGNFIPVTDSAKKHLLHLTGRTFTETATTHNFENKESIMTEAAAQAATEKKTKKPAPKTEAAPAKVSKKVAAPEAKASKKVAAPKEEKEPGTRTSKEAGQKIKVLIKKPEVRPGSNREKHFEAVLSSKTTDEAALKLREYTNKPWDVIRVCVAQGIIELS